MRINTQGDEAGATASDWLERVESVPDSVAPEVAHRPEQPKPGLRNTGTWLDLAGACKTPGIARR